MGSEFHDYLVLISKYFDKNKNCIKNGINYDDPLLIYFNNKEKSVELIKLYFELSEKCECVVLKDTLLKAIKRCEEDDKLKIHQYIIQNYYNKHYQP